MVADIGNYAGREQAYVKHSFLAGYLESLVYKTAGKFDEIAYVDGFSGPWQSRGENFEDTSLGIALAAIRKAKVSWKQHSRHVRMSAYLIEHSATAQRNLESVKAMFPDLAIHTYKADFITVVPQISAEIPAARVRFLLHRPEGVAVLSASLAR